MLNRGEMPIYEPGLKELVERNTKESRLKFSTDSPASIRASDIIFIAVGTPSSTDGSADLALFLKAAETIAENLNGYKIVVNKSTVPVGTAHKMAKVIREELGERNIPFDVVSNPEFLKEGAAIEDFMVPDRVVIGCDNVRVGALMEEVYAQFAKNGRPIITMSTRAAEMTKYAANAMLATKYFGVAEKIRFRTEVISARFDEPITDKAAAERQLVVIHAVGSSSQ